MGHSANMYGVSPIVQAWIKCIGMQKFSKSHQCNEGARYILLYRHVQRKCLHLYKALLNRGNVEAGRL